MSATRFTDIRWFDSIDSTNQYLLDQARAGAPEGVVAVADHQSAGRGRLGRRWEAPPAANLLVSVLLRPELPPGHRHLASAVVALAAIDAAASEAGVAASIKWPNDLLATDGRKLAGVLAEADLGSPGQVARPAIVVGIGINVSWPAAGDDVPGELAGVATSLQEQAGHPIDRRSLLDAVLDALEPRVAALDTASGRQEQAADLRRQCLTVGSRVRVELAGTSFEGLATEVTDEGHLVVVAETEVRTVIAGDVVHVRPTG